MNENDKAGKSVLTAKGVPSEIDFLCEGDFERTMMHVSVANQLIKSINMLLHSQGQNGITITKSDANWTIGFDPTKVNNGKGNTYGGGNNTTGSVQSGSINYYSCVCRYS